MSPDEPARRTLRVEALARVEGEGAMTVEISNGEVTDVELNIFEPPRFFEAFLRGRAYTEPPDITARICGICPVAYQMSSCAAIEDACGVTVEGALADLRRIMYCGEWIESHVLHIYMLHAPDFVGVPSVIELAALDRETVEAGLALKKVGNDLIELIGGRAVHPVNVKVGGFYRAPDESAMRAMGERLREARETALATVEWVSGFEFPDLETDFEFVSLREEGRYPVTGGRLVSSGGLDIAPGEFEQHFAEFQVPHSNALHSHMLERGDYLVGPIARYNLNFDRLSPLARRAATSAGLGPECRNPFKSIIVRAVEVVHACDEAIGLIEGYRRPAIPAVTVEPRAGTGYGWTEAPRGMLWHRYELDGDGTILDADIVPPTSQNQPAIERDLHRFVQANVALPDDELGRRAEQVIRNHDPCISCATHLMDVRINRVGEYRHR